MTEKIYDVSDTANGWQINEWVKRQLSCISPIQMETLEWYFWNHDKMPSTKRPNKTKKEFELSWVPTGKAMVAVHFCRQLFNAGSYVNIGAYVDEGTMVRYLRQRKVVCAQNW